MSNEDHLCGDFHDLTLSRRGLLSNAFTALAGMGLARLLGNEIHAAESDRGPDAAGGDWRPGVGRTHFRAKAQRVLQVFCPGGASHMDLWEHKPALEKYSGKHVARRRELRIVSEQERQPDAQPVAVRTGTIMN